VRGDRNTAVDLGQPPGKRFDNTELMARSRSWLVDHDYCRGVSATSGASSVPRGGTGRGPCSKPLHGLEHAPAALAVDQVPGEYPDEVLKGIAPIGYKNINLRGILTFTSRSSDRACSGALRPPP
jgi:hypothetical protein